MAEPTHDVQLVMRQTIQAVHSEGIEQMSWWVYRVDESAYSFTAPTTFDLDTPDSERHIPPTIVGKAIDTAIDERLAAEKNRADALKISAEMGGLAFVVAEVSDLATTDTKDYATALGETGEDLLFGSFVFFYCAFRFARQYRKQRNRIDRKLVGLSAVRNFVTEHQDH